MYSVVTLERTGPCYWLLGLVFYLVLVPQRVAGRGSFNRHGRQEEEIGSAYLLVIFGFT